jgi:hypothetical protein
MSAYCWDDGGNRTKLVQNTAVHQRGGNGRISGDLQKKKPGRKGREGRYKYGVPRLRKAERGDISMVSPD